MLTKEYFVYILASKKNGTLYTGMTNNLLRRVYEHKQGVIDSFTQKYRVHSLVYYDIFDDVCEAIQREKQIKKWRREWKIQLINQKNSAWEDLYAELTGE